VYAKPSSNSSFDHRRSDARSAKDKSPRRNGVNKSAKVVLGSVENQDSPLRLGVIQAFDG
jgi:predicted Holliday junction resolvase-like endonuclease